MQIILVHMSQVIWRHNSPELFSDYILHLRRFTLTCPTCSDIFLRLISADTYAFYNLLLQNPHPSVRSQTRDLIIDCLKKLREKEPVLYGLEAADSDVEMDIATQDEGLLAIVAKKLVDTVVHHSFDQFRGWNDLYSTVIKIAEMGQFEAGMLLSLRLLEFSLKLFVMHEHTQFAEYDCRNFVSIFSNKKGCFNKLIGVIVTLLSYTDINLPVVSQVIDDREDRIITFDRDSGKYPLNHLERNMIVYYAERIGLVALDKMLDQFDLRKPDPYYPGALIKWILGSREQQIHYNLFRTINEGLGAETPFCNLYIRPASAFCQASSNATYISRLVGAMTKLVDTREGEDEQGPNGDLALTFYIELLQADNKAMFESCGKFVFHDMVVKQSSKFAIPLLLNEEEYVRRRAQSFLQTLFEDIPGLPNLSMLGKYGVLRRHIKKMGERILYEKDVGLMKSQLDPMITTCNFFVEQLTALRDNDDEEMQQFKVAGDEDTIMNYLSQIEPSVRGWPVDERAEASEGAFDGASDFGSESDDEDAQLGP